MRLPLILILVFWSLALNAATGPWQSDGPVRARLISPLESVHVGKELPLALELDLEAGWKTYWRVAGAAGAAPRINVLSDGFAPTVRWQLPAPSTFTLLGFQSYGYEKQAVLPFFVEPIAQPLPDPMRFKATVFVCNNICIPVDLNLSLSLPESTNETTDWDVAPRYNEALSQYPVPNDDLTGEARFDEQGLYLSFPLQPIGQAPEIFVENLDVYEWPAPVITVDDGQVQAWWSRGEIRMPDIEERLVFTYKDSLQSFSSSLDLTEQSRPAAPDRPDLTEPDAALWLMLLAALLGGLILNAMPCVLPVLSIKLIGWLSWRDEAPAKIRLHSLATAAGVISFFWLLAAGLIALKATGAYVGWGIQFQSPWFLLVLFLVMLVFLANLLDKVTLQLPQTLQSGLLTVSEQGSGYVKSFLQGGAATLLATPCSAPFLGTAVAFAFTQNAGVLLLMFTSLGVGLALPYLLIAASPSVVRWLPKPGRWMVTLKRVMALGLLATLIWLGWLLNEHLNLIGLSVIAIAATLWLTLLYWPSLTTKVARFGLPLLAISMVAALLLFQAQPQTSSASAHWQTYSADAVSEHLNQGHTLLIDVTAQWCITCEFNKLTVLETDAMLVFYQQRDVVLMQADWTRPDPAIEALLATYNRSAIPFNLVLGPEATDGILLPELLTAKVLREAINRAQAN
ncbi:putative suppressor for copper-sensitivity B precursor [Reinekea sp. MED297]|uniref:Putative suppressor for copper-sensitivity B n=2 Tax=Reinekea TaxID=230494 RepID=A4BDJ5_9GAMM|nr:putative suppressor for copper-sensitivity B precursor [Reinekea sp. MED297] [Reinekea blandensis MED297]